MTIQWFPGHMTKAKRAIIEQLKAVDMVIECRDARIPFASSNPMIEELIQNKPRLIILTKRDLAETQVTDQWIDALKEVGQDVIALNCNKDNVKVKVSAGCAKAMEAKHQRDLKRGIRPRMTRALVVGVPNVGKSTLINRLANRKVVEIANRPGVTQSLKRIKVSPTLEVVDSPGLLWPRFDEQVLGIHLALCASIKETGFPIEEVCNYALEYFKEHRIEALQQKYHVDVIDESFYQHIAKERGQALNRGYEIFLKDVQNHEFGPLSWETPHERT